MLILIAELSTAAADTFCTRAFRLSNSDDYANPPNGIKGGSDNDPIRCVENSGGFTFQTGRRYSPCEQENWAVDIPIGESDADALTCNTFEDPLMEASSSFTLSCYYNRFSDKFCVKIMESARVEYQCFSTDEAVSVLYDVDCTTSSCRSRNYLVKRGNCDDPVQQLDWGEQEMTDEFVNGRNERINEENDCPISSLAIARADDSRMATVAIESCMDTGINEPEKCRSTNTHELVGQQVKVLGESADLIAQRQEDKVCFAWEHEDTHVGSTGTKKTRTCRDNCVGMGGKIRIQIREQFVYPTNLRSEDLLLTVAGAGGSDGGQKESEDKEHIDENSSGSGMNAACSLNLTLVTVLLVVLVPVVK